MKFAWILGLPFFLVSIFGLPAPLLQLSVCEAATAAQGHTSAEQDRENLDYFTDLKVTTHRGEELAFYNGVLKNKVVLINFFYVNCPSAPVSMIKMFQVRKLLGEDLPERLALISISVDPARDDLPAIQDYARKFNPPEQWVFLTGREEDLEVINRRLGNVGRLPEGHLQLFLLGNLRTGHWMRMIESAPAFAVAEGLRTLLTEE